MHYAQSNTLLSYVRSLYSSQLLKSSSIYLFGGLLNPAISFLLLPVLTRYLTPSDYGILAIINSVNGFLLNLVIFGQNSSLQRFFYDYDKDRSKELLINCFLIVSVTSLISGVLLWVFQSIFKYNFGFENWWLAVILFIAYSTAFKTLIQSHMQIAKHPITFVQISVSSFLITILLSIYLVVYRGYDWQGRVYASLIFGILFLVFGVGFMLFSNKVSLTPSKSVLKDISYFGSGLVPGALAGWGLNLADRFILSHMVGAATTGLYNIGYQFGYIVYLVVAACGRAWAPYFWENYLSKGEIGRRNIMRVSRNILIGIFLLALSVALIGPIILRIMVPPQFYEASKYIKWVAFGYAFQGLQIVFSPYLAYHKKTFLMSLIATTSVILNVILNLLLIPYYGGVGAAIATLLAFLFCLVVTMSFVYKLEGVSIINILEAE